MLKHEAIDYLQELRYRRDNETVFSALPQAEMDKPCSVDRYPSDSYVFSSYGCDLPIENELVAEAFASLSASDQSILILRCVMDLTDKEIGSVHGAVPECCPETPDADDRGPADKISGVNARRRESMSKSQHKGKELPPLSVIHAAQAGDAEAMDRILRYYEGYINKLSTRKFRDEFGRSVVLGITIDGRKNILGVWIGEHESSKFWLNVLNDLANQGQDMAVKLLKGYQKK